MVILLSGGPVIVELPFPYPDLVFTREWEGWFHPGTVGDFSYVGDSNSEGDFGAVGDFGLISNSSYEGDFGSVSDSSSGGDSSSDGDFGFVGD